MSIINALTFDVEDWFQVESLRSVVRVEDWDKYESRVGVNTRKILNILKDHRIKATFFILGWIAERFPDLIRHSHQENLKKLFFIRRPFWKI